MRQKREKLPVLVKWIILTVTGIILAWRIVAINMADHYAQENSAKGAASALQWDPGHPQGLFVQGVHDAVQDPKGAIEKLKGAIRKNPADGRSYAVLARLKEAQGDLPAAENAINIAARMAPQRTNVQNEAAEFWMRRGDITRAMEHWNIVLTFGKDLRANLFPGLLRLAENPATHAAFAPLLQKPVNWWPEFFTYAAVNAQQLNTVHALFNLQAKGPNAATTSALRPYLERLQREGYWTEAFFIWLNSLDKEQLNNVGNLFNGGFEYPISNIGFDWISVPAGQVLVETASTYGSTGNRALHVIFRGPRVAYRHLRQHLLLPPGNYSLRGRVRPESLETERGVQWGVYCLGKEIPLATSERFTGTDQWRHFTFQFTVPADDCPVQVARLELAGRVALEFEAKGGIWFDDLSLDRQNFD